MGFSKSFPRTIEGSTYPIWEEIKLTDKEEQEEEVNCRKENISLMKECIEDVKGVMKDKKLKDFPQVTVRAADAANPGGGPYDDVISFFLLHEMPEDYKHAVVNSLLDSLAPGGKVIFIDYHKPHWAHPLKWVTALVFALLEPFAKSLWHHEITGFAKDPGRFHWRQETYFGGLFQKVVAQRKPL